MYQWFTGQSHGDYKNVSMNQFYAFVHEKINKQKEETLKAQQDNQAYLASLMPPPANRTPQSHPYPTATS